MKLKILGLILMNCFVFLSAYSQEGEQKIKTISNAEYSPSRSGNLSMEEALRSKQRITKKRLRDGEVNYIWVREIEYHK